MRNQRTPGLVKLDEYIEKQKHSLNKIQTDFFQSKAWQDHVAGDTYMDVVQRYQLQKNIRKLSACSLLKSNFSLFMAAVYGKHMQKEEMAMEDMKTMAGELYGGETIEELTDKISV